MGFDRGLVEESLLMFFKSQNDQDWQRPLNHGVPLESITVPQCHIYKALNAFTDGDPTPFLDSLFQCLITFLVKEFFLISNLCRSFRKVTEEGVCSKAAWE